jgi:uncharacterized protein YdgA (DUF945 family)
MNKALVLGGSGLLLAGAAWAGTTWYGGHQIVQNLPQAMNKLSDNARGTFKVNVTKQDVGFLKSRVDWDMIITLDPCQPEQVITLTGYSIIHNGVVPSLGLGSVETHINYPTQMTKGLTELFGTAEPLQITTQVGLLGGTSTTLVSPVAKYKDGDDTVEWKGLNAHINANKSGSKISYSGTINGLDVNFAKDGMTGKLDKISFSADGKKGQSSFLLGKGSIQLDGLNITTAGKQYGFKDLKISTDSDESNGLLSMKNNAKLDQLLMDGKNLGKADIDLSLDHLDAAALKNIIDVQTAMSKQCKPTPEALLAALKPLMMKGFSATLNHIDVTLHDGKAHADAKVNLPALTDAEAQNPQTAFAKLELDGKANFNQALISQIVDFALSSKEAAGQTVTAEQKAQMVQAFLARPLAEGLLIKTADSYATALSYRAGQMLVNGKPLVPHAPAADPALAAPNMIQPAPIQ